MRRGAKKFQIVVLAMGQLTHILKLLKSVISAYKVIAVKELYLNKESYEHSVMQTVFVQTVIIFFSIFFK